MRYTIEYKSDDYDDPEQYLIRDTKRAMVVARIQVGDFTGKVDWKAAAGGIVARKAVCEAELLAIETVRLIAEKLEAAADNGEVA